MSNIPPDMYERVLELAWAIVNATGAEDEVLHDSHCQSLRAYYDEMAELGRSHPFLTETLADFTSDKLEAVRLYELALDQSRAFSDESTHTKMVCLAEALIELDRTEEAEAYIRDGRAEAVVKNDTSCIEQADRLLKQLAT